VPLLTGFLTILAVIACGVALAHTGVLDERAQRTLAEVSFFVATPALMLVTISQVRLDGAAAANVLASGASLLLAASVYAVVARVLWRRPGAEVLIGSLSSSYVNAGNLGVAVAAYVVGDTAVVVPTLLVQLLVVQPLSLAVLDRRSGRAEGSVAIATRVVTNPLTAASVAGLLLAVTDVSLPAPIDEPVRLVAGLAIPAMLLAYGAALRLSPPVGRAGHRREVVTATLLKLAVMPAVALLLGVLFGLDGPVLLGVVITAGLPTAQNIFLHATRYRVGEDVARETILVTTLCCLPVSLGIAVLLT
jgi:malonate transporter and related proteins